MKLKKLLIIALMIIVTLIVTGTFVKAKTVIVDTETLILRAEASKDSDTLKLLDNGDKLEYIEDAGEWYKVKVDGKTGYVSKEYSKLEEGSNTSEATNTESKKEEQTETPKQEEPTPTPEENKTQNNNSAQPTPTPKSTEQPKEAIPTQMKVSKDSNLYILPLINANIIQEVKANNNVKILSKTNGWYYIETSEAMGWIRASSLVDISVVSDDIEVQNKDENKTETDKNTTDTEITAKTMYVNSSSIYVRKGPGTDFEDIDSLSLNDSVKVIAENGDWYKVEVSGKTGYVSKQLLSDSETNTTTRSDVNREQANTSTADSSSNSSLGQQIVDYAMQFKGCPYVYGGSGPDVFDCSGFTMFVYQHFGIDLSHSVYAQSFEGNYVSRDELQAGDLVIFTDYETGETCGHVGIYIGGGDFIHASSGTGYCVKISTILSGSYDNRYDFARRII